MNLREIKELIDILKDTEVSELELEKAGTRIRIKMAGEGAVHYVEHVPAGIPMRQDTSVPAAQPPATPPHKETETKEEAESRNVVVINSPIVGTFYRSPSPDTASYVEVGDVVKKGQVICIIEAMKLMNEIEAEVGGRIVKILAENAQPVEYGEPLFHIEPV